ncbi:MAG TPA: helix-turn-helix domain-containing protein [Lacipirellulaceae bacterium]|nr:helix-turn-helix domain-containing protein [Lacipirellulaceae bacterium]
MIKKTVILVEAEVRKRRAAADSLLAHDYFVRDVDTVAEALDWLRGDPGRASTAILCLNYDRAVEFIHAWSYRTEPPPALLVLDVSQAIDYLCDRATAGWVVPLEEFERTAIDEALRLHQGNRTHAAQALGISVRTLQRKLKRRAQGAGAAPRRDGAEQIDFPAPPPA